MMTHTLKPYPKYKDSGAPWLGKIPAHWEVRRLKYTAPESGEKLGAKPEELPYVGLENVESGTGRLLLAEPTENVESTVVVFQEGDILFGKLRPYLAKVILADFNGVGTTELLVLRPQADVDARFLFYQLLSDRFIDTVNSLTYGAKMPRANSDQVGRLSVGIAPLEEQRAIARFLDHHDRRTRRYIRAQRRLIELLTEQKQALIQQAVTRGLDPDAPLKDSGIEWLGEVPEHWEVSRVKNEFENLDHRRIPLSATERGRMTNRKYDYYGASGVIDKVDDYLFDDELLLIAEDGANLVLRNLPLAIIARGKFWVNNHAHILKPKRGNIEYLANVMEMVDYRRWISGAAQPKLTQDRLMAIPIPIPPAEEQERIISQLGNETASLQEIIARAQRQINLIREYRTRLIADVVTGKLDVRGAPLPELDADGEPDDFDDLDTEEMNDAHD
jgi:type I restriction enzyme, S subunit